MNWIRVSAARNSFVGIEHLTDDELEEIRTKCETRAQAEKVGEVSVEKTGEKARRAADERWGRDSANPPRDKREILRYGHA